jgi:hypothetical protein
MSPGLLFENKPSCLAIYRCKFVHTRCALGVKGDGQGCPCDAFARAFHALWKEIGALIRASNTKTTFSPKSIEALAQAQFGTATKIKECVPLTAGR